MSRTRRSWLSKWLAGPRKNRLCSAKLRVEEMEKRLTPATFNVTPPSTMGADSAALRTDIGTANGNADPSNIIEMAGGNYTLTSGYLSITKDITFERDPMDTSGLPIVIIDDSTGSPGVMVMNTGIDVYLSDTSYNMMIDGAVAIGDGLAVSAGSTVILENGPLYAGGASPAYLFGDGTFSTDTVGGVEFDAVNIQPDVTVVSNSAADIFLNTHNLGTIDVAAGLNTGGSTATTNFDGFTNGVGSSADGTLTIGANTEVNVADFQSYGTVNLADGTGGMSGLSTRITNVGSSDLHFNGGSITEIGTAANASALDAGIDLHGHDLVATDHVGVFNNNGYVGDSVSGSTEVTDDLGFVKGAGTFFVNVHTINGGQFQAGDCPGVATLDGLTFGAGGVDNYRLQMDDATGTAGPSPDSGGHVDGWSLIKTGDFAFTADADHKIAVNLQTLSTETTEGNDVAGTMDNFNPTQSYSWAAVQWTGTYSGTTSNSALNAATTFDTSGFANSFNGTFAWNRDTGSNTLYLTYTPA